MIPDDGIPGVTDREVDAFLAERDADHRTLTLMLADELRDVAADLLRQADELTAAATDRDNCPPHGIERPTR